MTGVYVHVPFCQRKCPYCAFYSVCGGEDKKALYLSSLMRELDRAPSGIPADTLYFGGGTPALLGAERLSEIIDKFDKHFSFTSPEITVECNPNSITADDLHILRSAGVNRLSVGVQSLDDGELRFLGRLHNASQAELTILNALSAGFENISADLMIGIKGQSGKSLSDSVLRLSELGVRHISVYMIKVEQGTAFDSTSVRARLTDDDETAELYLSVVSACKENGFDHYEISNFARPGFESRHNLKYWRCEEYLGFGPSAHSYFGGVRYRNADTLEEYSALPDHGRAVTDPSPDKAEEYIMLGLRLKEGISLDKAVSLGFDPDRRIKALAYADRLSRSGLCLTEDDRISLTAKGMLVSNSIITDLIYG